VAAQLVASRVVLSSKESVSWLGNVCAVVICSPRVSCCVNEQKEGLPGGLAVVSRVAQRASVATYG
jgi:hypothetical protein